MQTTTFWAGLTNKNDMPNDNSRPHHLWTHEHPPSKQTVSEHWYWYYESRKNHKAIRMTSWPPKTRYNKASSALGLIQAALYRPFMTRLVQIPPMDQFYTINIVWKSLWDEKIGDRLPAWSFGWTSTEQHDVRINNSSAQQVWTHARSRSKQIVSQDLNQYYESIKRHKPIKVASWPPNTRYKKGSCVHKHSQLTPHRPQT
jgi:hypothetical protein